MPWPQRAAGPLLETLLQVAFAGLYSQVSPRLVPVAFRPPNKTPRCRPESQAIAVELRAGGEPPEIVIWVQVWLTALYSQVSAIDVPPLEPPNSTVRPRWAS